jgi:hypothetical protein
MKASKLLKSSIVLVLILLLLINGAVACQSGDDSSKVDISVTKVEQSEPQQQVEIDSAGEAKVDSATEASEESVEPTLVLEEDIEPDPAAIEAAWLSSPHSDTFVLDVEGKNNTCARCHAPVNWQPSMDDLPESCFTCKFELEDPPSYIPENEWVDIPCYICHKVDKKENIQPGFAWLEIAAIGEYAEVATSTELCQKCHNEVDLPNHPVSQVGGAHIDYACTDCHDAHGTTTSCGAVECHEDVVKPVTPIAGHDEDHQMVSCEACHDADGLVVGPSEDEGIWTTYILVSSGEGEIAVPHTSHNIILDAPCENCHFTENPWGLSESVSAP